MFDTIAESDQKLANTVILYRDSPVVVGGSSGQDGAVSLKVREFNLKPTLKKHEWLTVSINDTDLNMKNLGGKLGYINIPYEGYFCTVYTRRVPIRKAQSTQGLSNVNVRVDVNDALYKTFSYMPPEVFMKYETIGGLKETMEEKFPSLMLIKMEAGKTNFIESAFHRHLSIHKEFKDLFKLRYKNQEIGWSNDLDQFTVSREYKYLGELFEENNMRVRC